MNILSITQFLYSFRSILRLYIPRVNYLQRLEKVNSILIMFNGCNYVRNLFCSAITYAHFFTMLSMFILSRNKKLIDVNKRTFRYIDRAAYRDRVEWKPYRESMKIQAANRKEFRTV